MPHAIISQPDMFSAATRIGPYEILTQLGEGGIGEVYRAKDTELGREVAIKVLPPAFSADPERIARFQRESASPGCAEPSQHRVNLRIRTVRRRPRAGDELVEGPTLADRIAKGRLPVEEALTIAR